MEEELVALRKQIDELDRQLISLIKQRLILAKEIGAAKALGSAIYRPERETSLMAKLMDGAPVELSRLISIVWRGVISAGMAAQNPNFCISFSAHAKHHATAFAAGQLQLKRAENVEQALNSMLAGKADIAIVTNHDLKQLADRLGSDKDAMVIACLPLYKQTPPQQMAFIIGRHPPDDIAMNRGVYLNKSTNKIEITDITRYDSEANRQMLGVCTQIG